MVRWELSAGATAARGSMTGTMKLAITTSRDGREEEWSKDSIKPAASAAARAGARSEGDLGT